MASLSALELKEVTKTVISGGQPLTIVQDISLSVMAGESVAIVGASGSGKSTLLGLMAGLDSPSSGSVVLAGAPLSDLDEDGRARARAGKVGFVFQSFQLMPGLTARENVALPLELAGWPKPRAGATADEWLQRVGLAARGGHYPKHLSGGEQQRVALARAFATEPTIIFADEPTGNLDKVTGAQVIDLVFQLNRDQGTTLVLVTHDPELASRCGRVLHIDGGCLRREKRA